MRKYKTKIFILLGIFVFFTPLQLLFAHDEIGYAKGKVKRINLETNEVIIYEVVNRVPGDEAEFTHSYREGMEVEATYTVTKKTRFGKVNSLKDIAEGEIIAIEYKINDDGEKIAEYISIKKAVLPGKNNIEVIVSLR